MGTRIAVCVAVAVAVAAAGCGSSKKSSSGGGEQSAGGGPAPANLVGTYTTKLTKKDAARSKAPAVEQPSGGWKLVVSNRPSGSRKRTFSIVSQTQGELETSDFGVKGDRIVLKRETCEANGTARFYDNTYSFRRTGGKLRFTVVKNSCPDRIAETILTAESWARQGG